MTVLAIRTLSECVALEDNAQFGNADVAAAGFGPPTDSNSNISFSHIHKPSDHPWALGAIAQAGSGYCWDFGDHNGKRCRRAVSASLTGPWTILGPTSNYSTSMSLTALSLVTGLDLSTHSSSNNHFNGPHTIYADELQAVYQAIHGTIVNGSNVGWPHGAGMAVSKADMSAYRVILKNLGFDAGLVDTYVADIPAGEVGDTFRLLPIQLGAGQTGNPTYFRIFRILISGAWQWFAISNQGDLRRSEISSGVPDPLGISPYVSLPIPALWTNPIDSGALVRHVGTQLRGRLLLLGYSRPTEPDLDPTVPEHWKAVWADLRSDNWYEWYIFTTPVSIAYPNAIWEGLQYAIATYTTAVPGPKRILLDPSLYPDVVPANYAGPTYAYGCVMAEQFLAIYLLNQGLSVP